MLLLAVDEFPIHKGAAKWGDQDDGWALIEVHVSGVGRVADRAMVAAAVAELAVVVGRAVGRGKLSSVCLDTGKARRRVAAAHRARCLQRARTG